jgi:hypothetical protein
LFSLWGFHFSVEVSHLFIHSIHTIL